MQTQSIPNVPIPPPINFTQSTKPKSNFIIDIIINRKVQSAQSEKSQR